VILAAERRVSYGGFVVSKSGKKLFKITDRLGLACAGLFADMQNISKMLKANIEYYELVTGRPLSIKAAARLLASILYSNKLFPFLSETIVGGIDFDNTTRLYVMDPLGSLIEDDYAAIGSGAPIAIGVLEANYREDLKFDDAKNLIIKAIKAAIERDAISGDGIDILAFRLQNNQVVAEEHSITLKF
ncbi:MAG TPA: proteasome subunit beta, partial [Pyrodictium sp.]|nr:proteasome subunit beta [Pyrodictium sp.]